MKLDIPYYSQYLSVSDPYWMPRACGVACVKMVLDSYKKETASLEEMIEAGHADGGYGPSGWFHDYFVALFKVYDIDAYRKEGMDEKEGIQEIQRALEAGNPVIASIVKYILEQTKFHMVVLVGYTKDAQGNVKTLLYHDPEGVSEEQGAYREVDIETFLSGWRRMAIFISKA